MDSIKNVKKKQQTINRLKNVPILELETVRKYACKKIPAFKN